AARRRGVRRQRRHGGHAAPAAAADGTPGKGAAISMNARYGIVVIGRNEGKRLEACLDSVLRSAAAVVYVDSGSSDGSLAAARGRGVAVIELDPSTPFTAARARNA